MAAGPRPSRRIRRALRRRLGLVARVERDVARRRARFLEEAGVDLFLDIGAFVGRYAASLRRHGYRGEIVSFEPLKEPFEELQRAAERDPRWTARRIALGDRDGDIEINVAGNVVSSSVLPMSEAHLAAAPGSRYVRVERVPLRRLDPMLDELAGAGAVLGIKVDVQGYEDRVLAGADRALGRARFVEAELSLVPTYEGGATYLDLVAGLLDRGFEMVWCSPALLHRGRALQVDGLFLRS